MNTRALAGNWWIRAAGIAGTAMALLVGSKQVGCVLPHEALAKAQAELLYETKEDAAQVRAELTLSLASIVDELRAINTCLRERTCGTVAEPADNR